MQRIRIIQLIILAPALMALSACVPVTREGAARVEAGTAATAEAQTAGHGEAHGEAHWGYTGAGAPEFWGELNPDYTLCATGKSQSPIDITEVNQVDLTDIAFHYAPAPLTIVNNGHTIEVVYPAGSYIELGDERYNLQQFHFHAPSEHEIDGQLAALELHLVHKNEAGQLAVVGILFQEGAENAGLAPVWAHLPAAAGPEQSFSDEIDAAALLPADHTSFQYSGSLTTPPCSEGVTWIVLVQPEELSAGQLAAFTAIYDGNHRPVQPLNGREILEDVTP